MGNVEPRVGDPEPTVTTAAPARRRRVWITRGAKVRLAVLGGAIVIALALAWWTMIVMPGTTHRGPLPAITPEEVALADELRRDVQTLAGEIGPRSPFQHRKMGEAASYIIERLRAAGFAMHEEVPVPAGAQTPTIVVEVPGTTRASEIVIVGAHYDTFYETPGADDNASGVAGTLALAQRFAGRPQARTLRFAIFVNEEPPHFWTPEMGSWVYAKACRARGDNVVAMWSLESIGFYSDAPGSQRYPTPLNLVYPSTGDFIAFVGNVGSRALVRDTVASFRRVAAFPSQGAALPGVLPGVGWSDHWSFWQEGYPALMVTCTAPYRNPNYHKVTDTPNTLDYERTARVVAGLERVLQELANPAP